MKRVLLYRFDRQPVEAVVDPVEYLQDLHIELITPGGSLQKALLGEVKAICFAAEPGRPDLFTNQNLFERRPKVPGLWARFTFRDGERLDGILSHNLIDWPKAGYLLTPPRASLARQRVFIPREALAQTELCGVVGVPSAAGIHRKSSHPAKLEDQLRMFDR